jgi:hypothetical protein
MSQFYDLASLVVIPSGYKASTIYAQKPLTTDGQLSFSRASTATRVNASGLIEAVASNVPRLDYTNSSCPRLLLEPQRTNLVLYASDFTNAAWVKSGCTVSGDTLTGSSGTSFKGVSQNETTQGQQVIYFDVAYVSHRWVQILVGSGGSDLGTANFDVQNKVLGTFQGGMVPTITDYGTFVRISVTYTTANKTAPVLCLVDSGTAGRADSTSSTGSIKIFRAQNELGAYGTSFVPTTTAAVTRVADAASKTGISSLIGQTEGTIFVEEFYDASVANNGGLDDVLVALTDGTTNNLFLILHYGVAPAGYSNVARFFIRTAGATQAQFDSVALPSGTYKIALAYKNNDVVAYINGVQVGTDTSATIPATSVLTLVDPITTNAATKTVNIKQALLFKTRLTNAQLSELTTL